MVEHYVPRRFIWRPSEASGKPDSTGSQTNNLESQVVLNDFGFLGSASSFVLGVACCKLPLCPPDLSWMPLAPCPLPSPRALARERWNQGRQGVCSIADVILGFKQVLFVNLKPNYLYNKQVTIYRDVLLVMFFSVKCRVNIKNQSEELQLHGLLVHIHLRVEFMLSFHFKK